MKVQLLKDLEPGTMFRRETGSYRYIVSNQREESCGNVSIYCYNLDGESEGYNQRGNERVVILPVAVELRPKPEPFWICYQPTLVIWDEQL